MLSEKLESIINYHMESVLWEMKLLKSDFKDLDFDCALREVDNALDQLDTIKTALYEYMDLISE